MAEAMRVRRALVVDDDADLREMFSALLEQYGVDVEAVSCAEEALVCLEAGAPDMMFIDVAMPRTSGDELARVVRKKAPGLRLIAVSGFDAARVRLLGAFDDVLGKPVDLPHLEALLGRT